MGAWGCRGASGGGTHFYTEDGLYRVALTGVGSEFSFAEIRRSGGGAEKLAESRA